MEEKDEENDKKSRTQSLLRSRSRVQSEGEVPAADENAEVEPSKEPSVTYAPSQHSNVVTAPSALKSKSASEKSKSNVSGSAKVSIKTNGENEQDTGTVAGSLLRGGSMPGSQITVAHTTATGGSNAGLVVNGSNSKGVVGTSVGGLTPSSGNRGTGATSGGGPAGLLQGTLACPAGLLQKRSPFIHDPPYPEERRARIQPPRTPIDYIINLREDLADFQESHGLPRTRDYSFVSLGLALAQETGRAILSVFQMFTELFPILAIVSLILRFALDKLIEILETTDPVAKIKKSIIFALEMLAIMIPLWILFGTIIIPLITLILSLFKRVLRIRGGKKTPPKPRPKPVKTCPLK